MKNTRLVVGLFAAMLLASGLFAGEASFHAGPGASLKVDLETGGSVEINGSTTSEVKVKWEITGRDADNVRVNADSVGGRIQISSAYIEKRRQNSSSVKLWISVPNRFDMDIRTTGGNVNISNVEGRIAGETMGGNLAMTELKGNLKFTTMGGNISLSDSEIDGKASTMGGNISIKNVAGNVDVSTMGGNVILDNVVKRGGRSIDEVVLVSTMGGNIIVANAPHGAKVETKGGNIVIQKASKSVEAKTMGGNISINEHDGRIEASTMGGNVSAVIIPGGQDQNVDIQSMAGKIELTLPSAFSGTFDLEIAYTRKTGKGYEIISDFPIRQEEKPEWDRSQGDARKHIYGTGTAGTGANKVKIRTVNGDIVIRKK